MTIAPAATEPMAISGTRRSVAFAANATVNHVRHRAASKRRYAPTMSLSRLSSYAKWSTKARSPSANEPMRSPSSTKPARNRQRRAHRPLQRFAWSPFLSRLLRPEGRVDASRADRRFRGPCERLPVSGRPDRVTGRERLITRGADVTQAWRKCRRASSSRRSRTGLPRIETPSFARCQCASTRSLAGSG